MGCAFSLPSPVEAQNSTAESAQAREFFRQGLELSESGDWETAADRFRRSFALRPSAVVAFNLGTALTHLGRLVEAVEMFRQAVREGNDQLRTAAEEQVAQLEPQLGRLTIRVDGPRDGVEFQIDRRAIPPALLGAAMAADPGNRHITATRDEEVIAEAQAEIQSGEAAVVMLTLPVPEFRAASPAPHPDIAPIVVAQPQASTDEGGDDGVLWGVILGVAAAALIGGGIAIGVAVTSGEAQPIEGNLGPPVVEFGP